MTFTKTVSGVISQSMAVRFMSPGLALILPSKFVDKRLTSTPAGAIITLYS